MKKKYMMIIALVLLCAVAGIIYFAAGSGSSAKDYDEIAEQYSQYEFGAVNPGLCYVGSDSVILYDSRGIVVYNIKKEKICGYASFEEIGPVYLQGENPTFIKASGDGKYVYVYEEQGEKYLFDVSKDVFERVEAFDNKFESAISKPELYEGEWAQSDKAYSIGEVFQYGVNGYCYLGISSSTDEEEVNYSDLRLVVSEDGIQKEYAVFQ